MKQTDELHMISGFDLLRMEFPQHQFCVQDILPKGLNVLFSENVDKAKSLAMDLALRVAEGQNLWGMEVQQGAVLHMVHKDTLAVTRNRLVSMTKRVPDALYIGVMTESDMELVLSAVPEFMESNPELSLVVVEVETPVAYMSQKLYAPGELLLQYTRLKKLAAEKNITILVVQRDVLYSTSLCNYGEEGSASISEAVDSCFELKINLFSDSTGDLKRTSRSYGNVQWSIEYSMKTRRWHGEKKK